jgi:hypothetical protein
MATTPALSTIEERRIDGNYGEVFHQGKYQGDILDISGRIAIERRELPRAGTNTMVYRRGRITREGTVRLGKVDSRFEALIINYASKSAAEHRAARGQGRPVFPDTEFTIKIDDPDSWGSEEIKISGVKIWEIGIGFTSGDMLERDLPITWHTEQLLHAIPRPGNRQGLQGYDVSLPPGDITTWGDVAGSDPDHVV